METNLFQATAIIVDDEELSRLLLKNKLEENCPMIKVIELCDSAVQAKDAIQRLSPDLVFLDIAMPDKTGIDLLNELPTLDFEIIFVTGFNSFAIEAIQLSAIGYILKPIQTDLLVAAVNNAVTRIREKKENQRNKIFIQNVLNPDVSKKKIGIPTEEGLDFVSFEEIIRCEGFAKYTKVILKSGKVLLSSYNIGEFRRLLENYNFYACHKSHLINLLHIKKYMKEGSILMEDDSYVPVSKRRKAEFLKVLTRI